MEDQNMNPTPSTPATPPPAAAPVAASEPKKAPAYGTILGIILIVVILVVGAFYVWGERLDKEQPQEYGVRGEQLPDGSMPSVEGAADVESGPSGPQPQ